MDINELIEINSKEIEKESIILTDEIFCTRKYGKPKHICPNYNNNSLCPPFTKNINLDLYNKYILIYAKFDYKQYKELRKIEQPNWSEKQIECVLYWQNSIKKTLKSYITTEIINGFNYDLFGCGSGMFNSSSMEAVGINVFSTMKLNGIKLEIRPKNVIYLVCLYCVKEGKERGLDKWLK